MKKSRLICLLILVAFCCGCTTKSSDEHEVQEMEPQKPTNSLQQLYGADNKVIDELELYHIVGQTNDGIVYAKVTPESNIRSKELEYYHYVFENKETIKLGSVKNWYQESSDLIYIDNHLYLLITTKEVNEEHTAFTLFDIDLNNNTMTEAYTEQQDIYNKMAMAVAGDRVVMSIARANGISVEAYNTKTKEMQQLKKFEFDNDSKIGETIQHISADEDTISLLICKRQSRTEVSLRADVYDYNMNFIRSIDLSPITTDIDELQNPVKEFHVTKKHIYVQNYFVTSFLGKIKNNGVAQLMRNDYEFSKAYDVEKSKTTSLYYQAFDNKLYLLNETDGTIKEATFYMDDKRYSITDVSRDYNNNYLITMYRPNEDGEERCPERLCYVKSTELEFK